MTRCARPGSYSLAKSTYSVAVGTGTSTEFTSNALPALAVALCQAAKFTLPRLLLFAKKYAWNGAEYVLWSNTSVGWIAGHPSHRPVDRYAEVRKVMWLSGGAYTSLPVNMLGLVWVKTVSPAPQNHWVSIVPRAT